MTIAEPSDVIEPSVPEPYPSVESVQPVDLALAHHSVDLKDAGRPIQSPQASIDVDIHKDEIEPAGPEASNVTAVDALVPSNETQAEEPSDTVHPHAEVSLPSNQTQAEEPHQTAQSPANETQEVEEPVQTHVDVTPPANETQIDEPIKVEPQAEEPSEKAESHPAPAMSNATIPENATTNDKEQKTEEAFLDALKPFKGNATDEMPLSAQASAGITSVDPASTKTAASSKRHHLGDYVEQDLAALHEAPVSPQSNAPPVEETTHHEPVHNKSLDAIDSIEQKIKKHESDQIKLPGPSSDQMPSEPSLEEDLSAKLDTSPMRPRPRPRPKLLIKPRPWPVRIRPNTNYCPPCRK